MARNSPASQIALLVGAFAVSFFATVLVRKSAPAADVAPSPWTGDAQAAAGVREREESLARGVAALKLESRRLSEQVTRKSQELSARLGKARSADPGGAPAAPESLAALDRMTGPLVKMVVRDKSRSAKEEYGLTAPQLAAYEARLQETAEKNPLLLLENGAVRFDEEFLAPLLDREQLAKFRERAKAQSEMQARSDAHRIAALLEIPPDQGAKVFAILREEGVEDENAVLRYTNKPGDVRELLPHYASATDRARARLRPMLSPEAFEKLDRHFEEEGEALKFLIEELEKENKKE